MSEKYRKFLRIVGRFIPRERIYTDPLRRLAWGTDAGFYRLVPQIVVRSVDEQEVVRLLRTARSLHLPVTFRAAGTSLSGQTVSDSILIVAGKHWERYEVLDGGDAIRLQPGIVGAQVNRILKPYGRRFSPDPASVASAMVGGIVMNNASGMNCGTTARCSIRATRRAARPSPQATARCCTAWRGCAGRCSPTRPSCSASATSIRSRTSRD